MLDTLVVIAADLSLTIVIFTLCFPLAIVGATSIVDRQRVVSHITLAPFDAKRVQFDENGAKFGSQNLKQFSVRVSKSPEKRTSAVRVIVWTDEAMQAHSVIQAVTEILRSGVKDIEIVQSLQDKIDLKLVFDRQRPEFRWLRSLYYAAFVQGNVIRDSFLGVLQLEPLVVPYANIYAAAARWEKIAFDNAPYRAIIKCKDGSIKHQDIVVDQVGNTEPLCPVSAAILLDDHRHLERELRVLAFGSEGIPLTPFFLTSFASSLLYYCAMILLFGGAFFLRLSKKVVSVPYLDTPNKPFTVLALVLFVPALVLWGVIRLLT